MSIDKLKFVANSTTLCCKNQTCSFVNYGSSFLQKIALTNSKEDID